MRYGLTEMGVDRSKDACLPAAGIMGAAVSLMLLTLASKVLGFAREQVIAGYYGATGTTDAYLVGGTLPNILSGLLGTTIGFVFLPVYTRTLCDAGRVAAARLLNSVLVACVLPALVIVLAGYSFAEPLVILSAPGLDTQIASQAATVLRVMLPGVVCLIAATIVGAALNAHGEFTAPGCSPIAQNAFLIAIAVAFAQAGVNALALGTLTGMIMFLAVQCPAWGRLALSRPLAVSLGDPVLRRMARTGFPVLLVALLMQSYQVVDRYLASSLPPGNIAMLSFADRLRQLPDGLFAGVLSTILFPRLSAAAASKNWDEFNDYVGKGVLVISILALPSAILLASLGVPIVRLLFEHGIFDASATVGTATALFMYAVGVPFIGIRGFLLLAHYALLNFASPTYIYGIMIAVNVILDVLLVRPWGIAGIALANSVSSMLAAGFLFVALRKEVSKCSDGIASGMPIVRFVYALLKVSVAGWLMIVATRQAMGWVEVERPAGLVGEFVAVAFPAVVGAAVYGAMLLALGVREAYSPVRWALAKMGSFYNRR